MRLDAVYGALSASAPPVRGPADNPSPALFLTLSCPKLALVLERALTPNPAVDPSWNPLPDTAAPREALELALLGIQASVQVPGGSGTVCRESKSREAGAPATSPCVHDTEGARSLFASMLTEGHGRTCEQSGSGLKNLCWKATAARLHVTVRNGMPAEAQPFVLLASPAAGVPASPTRSAPPLPSEHFLALEWGSAAARISPKGDGVATGAEPEALRVCVAPIDTRLAPAIAARLMRMGPYLGVLADSAAELAREAGPAPVRAAVASAASRGGRRRLLTDAPATLRLVKVGLTWHSLSSFLHKCACQHEAVHSHQSHFARSRICPMQVFMQVRGRVRCR